MVAEIRRLGKRNLVLYTDDARVYGQFHKWKNTLREIPYYQGGKKVGIDFYFDRKLRRIIVQILKGQTMLDI